MNDAGEMKWRETGRLAYYHNDVAVYTLRSPSGDIRVSISSTLGKEDLRRHFCAILNAYANFMVNGDTGEYRYE